MQVPVPIVGYELVVQDEYRKEVAHPVQFAVVNLASNGQMGIGAYVALDEEGKPVTDGKLRRVGID